MMERIAGASPRFKARIAGALSLFSLLTAGFTEPFVRGPGTPRRSNLRREQLALSDAESCEGGAEENQSAGFRRGSKDKGIDVLHPAGKGALDASGSELIDGAAKFICLEQVAFAVKRQAKRTV